VDGNIWFGTTMIFRIIDDRVYSMHEQYLGRLQYGMAMTESWKRSAARLLD